MSRYFKIPGPHNTQDVIEVVKSRIKELKIKHVVVNSITGESAILVANSLKDLDVEIICVTCPPNIYLDLTDTGNSAYTTIPSLDKIRMDLKNKGMKKFPLKISNQNLKKLNELGVKVVMAATSFFGVNFSFRRYLGLVTPAAIVSKTLDLFSPGTSACAEGVMMATDASAIKQEETVIALAGTERGLDSAYVVRASTSASMFDSKIGLRFLELLAKPRLPVLSESNNYLK